MNSLFIKRMCSLTDQKLLDEIFKSAWSRTHNKTHKDILITPTQETLKSAVLKHNFISFPLLMTPFSDTDTDILINADDPDPI